MEAAIHPATEILIHGSRHVINYVSPSKNRMKADECLSSSNQKLKDMLTRIDPQDKKNLYLTKHLVDENSLLHDKRVNLQTAVTNNTVGNIRLVKKSHQLRQKAEHHLEIVHVTSQGIEADNIARSMQAALAMASPQSAGKRPYSSPNNTCHYLTQPDTFGIGDLAVALPTTGHTGHAAAHIGVSYVYPSPRDIVPSPSANYQNDDVYPFYEGAGLRRGGTIRQTGPNNSLEFACVEPGCTWRGYTVKNLQDHRVDEHISCTCEGCGRSFPSGNTRVHHLTCCGLYLNAYVKYAPNASEDTGMPHSNPSGGHPASPTSWASPGGHTVDLEPNLSCPACNQELDSVAELEEHNKFFHTPCTCPGCGAGYDSRFEREIHLKEYTDHWPDSS
ncbi:hypothetical protein BU17DRAFT_89447 [Hysterangium stoloniferum]|nr:hypothetical protein BU17DRAFT_89447 [Hysterangium stoloniferum]